MIRRFLNTFFTSIFLLQILFSSAQEQDDRWQYPPALANSFAGVKIGYINYPFSQLQLEPGFHAGSINVPHTAVCINLFGHQFNKYLSAQIVYMRPVDWVKYKNINGDQTEHSVWMNFAGATAKAELPVGKNFSVYTEAGLVFVTRKGFSINNTTVIGNAAFADILVGGGLQYGINNKWKIMLNAEFVPAHSASKQPHTGFYSAGFTYTMRKLPETKKHSRYFLPKNVFQVGYTTNALGYGTNDFVSKGAIPVFWGGDVQIGSGVSFQYRQNIFHTQKVFSLDWAAGVSIWQSRNQKNKFYTVSLFPLLRFMAVRSKPLDFYFMYSVAGPTFISKFFIDSQVIGRHFTFQDFMGIGIYTGKKRNFNAEIRIMHFSNGNIYPQNLGLMIPLTAALGYSF